jgi:CRAL/TRIO domain
LTKAVISTLRLFFKYLQDAHPVKIVQLHVVNCTPVVNKAMLLIKPFIYAKLYNALKFHNAGSYDSLYESIPREILPSDLGGDAQSMADLKKHWVKVLNDHRDFVMNDDYFKLNAVETKDYVKERQKVGGIFSFLTS